MIYIVTILVCFYASAAVVVDKFWIDVEEAKTLVECTKTDTSELNKKIRDTAKKGETILSLKRECTECEKRSLISRGFRVDRKMKMLDGPYSYEYPEPKTCEIGWY